jgi:hypothetical protein
MKDGDSLADKVPTESDDVGVMKEGNSSIPVADKVPTESDEIVHWSYLDNKFQSAEERKNLQEQFEKELNKYIFDMTQNSST